MHSTGVGGVLLWYLKGPFNIGRSYTAVYDWKLLHLGQ